jgi:hypothetical protein
MTVQTGADVARDPDAIAREIEETRAELAQTVDELADRLSPKRAANRTVARLRERLEELRRGAAARGTEASTGRFGTTYVAGRRLRLDRVAIVAGALTTVAVAVAVLRRRSS